MSTPVRHVWTLDRVEGDADGQMLQGCHIVSHGTVFHFTEPDIHHVLSSTASSLTPTVPFTFPIFKYKEFDWAITVWTLPVAADASGSWSTPGADAPNTGTQNGDFTAQTGGEIDTGKAASSAQG